MRLMCMVMEWFFSTRAWKSSCLMGAVLVSVRVSALALRASSERMLISPKISPAFSKARVFTRPSLASLLIFTRPGAMG